MSPADLIMFAALPLLLTVSGFFSGCETALFSLSHQDRMKLGRSNALAASAATTLLSETRPLLISLLLSNMTINVAYFVISTVLLVRLKSEYEMGTLLVSVFSVMPLLALILLGEVLPKLLASRLAPAWSRVTSVPLLIVHRTLAPLRGILSVFVIAPLARLIGPAERPPALSADELETLLQISQEQGVINDEEEQLLQQVLELSHIKVRELMTPRVDIKAFCLTDPLEELANVVRNTRLSYLPIYHDDLDHIKGVVYARQILMYPPSTLDQLRPLIHQVKWVPEQQRADQLLVDLRKTGTTFAIVVDEYGGTAGLITLEDVVEELVGQIAGPYDSAQGSKVEPIAPGQWRVSANLPIHNWGQAFSGLSNVHHDSAIESVSTAGGLVMARLGRVPMVGDRVIIGNVAMEVEQMNQRRISTLRVRLLEEKSRADTPRANSGSHDRKGKTANE